jgi:undecaprenyl pyrophosphate phosphatase UppP
MGMTQFIVAVLHVPHLARPMADWVGFAPLYVGPDQMLPVMSALGAVVGVLLMLWNRVVALVRKAFRLVMKRSASESSATTGRGPQAVEPPDGQP